VAALPEVRGLGIRTTASSTTIVCVLPSVLDHDARDPSALSSLSSERG
jgi:hypothetical protein